MKLQKHKFFDDRHAKKLRLPVSISHSLFPLSLPLSLSLSFLTSQIAVLWLLLFAFLCIAIVAAVFIFVPNSSEMRKLKYAAGKLLFNRNLFGRFLIAAKQVKFVYIFKAHTSAVAKIGYSLHTLT